MAQFEITAGKNYGKYKEEVGLYPSRDNSMYMMSTKLKKTIDNYDKPLILSYTY
jgi:hypothetical protein